MTEPTDAEILDAAEDFRSQYKHGGTTFDEFDALDFARAVLAKWGTPAPVGVEPVASKSHGAWDGIEDVLDMPNGTDLYTADQALAMGRVPPGWQAVPLEATHEMIMASGPTSQRQPFGAPCSRQRHQSSKEASMALTPEQNRDEIIAMALVAGMSANIGYTEASGEHFPAVAALKTSVPVQWLERFAALVAAKEREIGPLVVDVTR